MSVPIATWGVSQHHAREVPKLIAPGYDVVHACTDTATALRELPALFSGDTSVRPSNGIGSNASLADSEPSRIPKVMAYGGGITADLKQQLFAAIKEKAGGASWGEEVKHVEMSREKVLKRTNGQPPSPEVSAEFLIEALKEAGVEA